MRKAVFKLPDIGEGIVEGEIVEWNVQVGDFVKEDDSLCELQTDKATVVIPSPYEGTVLSLTGKPGEFVAVGSDLIIFEVEGDELPEDKQEKTETPAIEKSLQEETAVGIAVGGFLPFTSSEELYKEPVKKILASPFVRQTAKNFGINLGEISGTGIKGRIRECDLNSYKDHHNPHKPSTDLSSFDLSDVEEIKIIGLRRKIAEKMALSKKHIPHFCYFEELEITELEKLRQKMNKTSDVKFTYLAFIMMAVCKALTGNFTKLNGYYDAGNEVILRKKSVNLGIAVQTEHGLKVAVIKNVQNMDIIKCANELRRVSDRVKDGSATIDELTGSTFTLTSLGALGGLGATPIINYPEMGILGVHRAEDRAVVRDGEITIRTMMNLSVAFDHRPMDGYNGAMFVQEVKELLSNPEKLI